MVRMSSSQAEPPFTGGCLCGAVRYVVRAAPVNVRICHCGLCRRATGAPFYARAMFPRAAVSITGETGAFSSSPDLRRRFCTHCGTSLFAERLSRSDMLSVTLGSLDEPGRIAPTMHIFTSDKVPWISLDDGLPQHREFPP